MKSALLFAVLLFVSSVLALSEQEYQDAFLAWTKTYNKAYSSVEFGARYNAFKDNLDYVNAWNAKNSSTILGTNLFADLTNAEYRKLYLGTHFDGTARLAAAEAARNAFIPEANPTSVDWVSQGAVTDIKDQGQCGSCWAFSTTGSVEGITYLVKGNLPSLSEQNLMDCSTAYGNDGCNGGLMDQAFRYIIANKGIDTEASYPYTMASEACAYKAANIGATITGFTDVTSGSEAALQTATVKQPVSVAIDASHNSFQLYVSGVYSEPACSATSLDHGVLSVGYGTAAAGGDFWLVKNSWGKSWGLTGYIWMSRNNNNNCGIATMASYPLIAM